MTRFLRKMQGLPGRLERIQEALGRIEARQLASSGGNWLDSEYRVFSQWGEDGLIQHLLGRIPVERAAFVEFGVEDYTEANTRFLVGQRHWSGLVIDASMRNIEEIRRDRIYWAENVKAVCAFVTRENINGLLEGNGFTGDIALLSIDIDGNDYWVWEAITSISPRIVICEYNSHFGAKARVTIPYDPTFSRATAHHSRIYYGASIAALEDLGRSKGYCLVAGNSAGNNAFFVREDVRGSFICRSASEVYRQAQFREFHDERGRLTFDGFDDRLSKIGHLPVFDLETRSLTHIQDVAAQSGR